MAEAKRIIGWREWVALPALGIDALKCKIDTGAKTSALHAFYVETFEEGGKRMVRFGMHPHQEETDTVVHCTTEVFDVRTVSDSGGHREERIVIKTPLRLGEETFEAEITLTNRDSMKFRMLLGRRAMQGRYLVNPDASYLAARNVL